MAQVKVTRAAERLIIDVAAGYDNPFRVSEQPFGLKECIKTLTSDPALYDHCSRSHSNPSPNNRARISCHLSLYSSLKPCN